VLSHLGSGSVIGLAAVDASSQGKPHPGQEFNLGVWDRWNAMSRRERADEFLKANALLVDRYESMDHETRENLRIDLGFLPAPVDVNTAATMRLSEFALHSWDVHVSFDPTAALAPEAVEPLLERGDVLFGWISKPAVLEGKSSVLKVQTTGPDRVFALNLGERITLDSDVPSRPDGTLSLPAESWLRLVSGRLSPTHTPASASVSGNAELDLLRRVFPGY
jgi:hypothetical protein